MIKKHLFVLLIGSSICGAVLAASDIKSVCTEGLPWFLPAAPDPAGGKESSMVVAMNASTPIATKICNCAAQEDPSTFVDINTNITSVGGSKGPVSRLYVGSCLIAVGNTITIRNQDAQKAQRGVFFP